MQSVSCWRTLFSTRLWAGVVRTGAFFLESQTFMTARPRGQGSDTLMRCGPGRAPPRRPARRRRSRRIRRPGPRQTSTPSRAGTRLGALVLPGRTARLAGACNSPQAHRAASAQPTGNIDQAASPRQAGAFSASPTRLHRTVMVSMARWPLPSAAHPARRGINSFTGGLLGKNAVTTSGQERPGALVGPAVNASRARS